EPLARHLSDRHDSGLHGAQLDHPPRSVALAARAPRAQLRYRRMKRKAGTTEYAVLGMLAMGPGSGYDLKKRIEGSIAHFWSESYGQIYPIVSRLAAEGLIARRLERQKGKPDRHVYSITAAGHERLGRWLGEPAREQGIRSELLLKLFFGRHRPVEETIRHVSRVREHQQELL